MTNEPPAHQRTRPLAGATLVAFLPTDDLDRSRTFFVEVVGLRLIHDDAYACTYDVGGTRLRVNLVQPFERPPHTVLGWDVAHLVDATAALTARGVTFERYDGMTQDASGIWTAPNGDLVAWFKDPDGNTLSLTQHRSSR